MNESQPDETQQPADVGDAQQFSDEGEDEESDEIEEIVLRVPEQWEIDEINMMNLNVANRLYCKCVAGNCPLEQDNQSKQDMAKKKPKNLTSSKLHDKKNSRVWVEKGRDHRMKLLEDQVKELDMKISVASGRTHLNNHEKSFKGITHTIREMETMDEQIKKTKLEISHLKSQLVRVSQKKDELGRETESEDQFTSHLRQANRQLEIFEGRVLTARQQECLMTAENRKLRILLDNILIDRRIFNFYWSRVVDNLKDRRKFLLKLIERSNQAFNRGADLLDSFKRFQSRRVAEKNLHVSEMINMERQIDANQIMNMFLGVKGTRRELAPLENRVIKRRDDFKVEYTNRLNLYNSIIQKIKEFTGVSDILKAKNFYMREVDGLEYDNYFYDLNRQIDVLSSNHFNLSAEILASQDYNTRKVKFFDQRIDDLEKQFSKEINKTLELKNERDKHEDEIGKFLDTIMEILKILKCDLSPLQKLLGNHKKVTVFNVPQFLSLLERRTNEVLAYVYCDQRKNTELLIDDPKMIVKSLKRFEEEPV